MIKGSKKTEVVKKLSSKKKSTSIATTTRASSRDIKSVSYQDYLIKSLRDPEEAAGYLNAALFGNDINVFLLALQNVVQAQGGMTVLSEKTHKSRTSLYKSLSERGNPYLRSTTELLGAMGMHLAVIPDKQWATMNQNIGP